jgi:hypothetical protein
VSRNGIVLCSDIRCKTGSGCTSHIPALEHVANRPIAHYVQDALLAADADQLVIAGTTVATSMLFCSAAHQKAVARSLSQ